MVRRVFRRATASAVGLADLTQVQRVDPPLNFLTQAPVMGVAKGNQSRPCLSEGFAAALYRILRCEPGKPNPIDCNPSLQKNFLSEGCVRHLAGQNTSDTQPSGDLHSLRHANGWRLVKIAHPWMSVTAGG